MSPWKENGIELGRANLAEPHGRVERRECVAHFGDFLSRRIATWIDGRRSTSRARNGNLCAGFRKLLEGF
jgi:hypothetical protein